MPLTFGNMNHTLSETYNIDTVIQNVQNALYDNLDWGIIDGFGRVYRNEKNGVVIPEVFLEGINGYKDVYYNDKTSFFFIDSKTHTTDDQISFNANVKIAFMVNLEQVKTDSLRVDAMVRRDVLEVLRNNQYDFEITGYEQTIDEVFRGFDTSKIEKLDMQPYHTFAITGKINYLITDKC